MSQTDKRTVATDALETLGTIITAGGRDAIHLAVEPVVAGMHLRPGDHVTLVDGKAILSGKGLGIVDPFLERAVAPGEMFWLVVYPRQITSLRHVWEHPAFPVEGATVAVADDPAAASRKWIENFAASIPLAYKMVMDGARDYVEDRKQGGYGEYLNFGGLLEGECVPDEFWPHYERVTGETVAEDHRGSFFTCSC